MLWSHAVVASAQSMNVDFGMPEDGPAPTYAAAGLAGVWNSIEAAHGTTTGGLVDLGGDPTAVSIRQIGGLALLDDPDPSITGDDAWLMDDFIVTYNAGLESCLFLEGLAPGPYLVLVYARMPDPAVFSYTSADQENGIPHYSVGGPWPGAHADLVSFSRHRVLVAADGELQLHSGIVPGADPLLGAALNGVQLIRLVAVFADGFESGDTTGWPATVPLS